MSLSVGNPILAQDFISIKSRIKSECERRNLNGSVASYATAKYDYKVVPTAGSVPLTEHYNKIIIPYNALTGSSLAQKNVGNIIPQLKTISDKLSVLESISAEASNSGCKSSCTGLCQGTCASGCTGCTGGCQAECTGGCKNGCGQSCSGSCSLNCSFDGCSNGCDDACKFNCSEYCSNSCTDTCAGGCKNGCMGSCSGKVTNITPNDN